MIRPLQALCLSSVLLFFGSCEKQFDPPNILLISLDTLRADHLGSYGYHRTTSPFLDDLAVNGMLFSNAFVNTHGTPPSHATILTSLYQGSHRVSHNLDTGPAKHAVSENLVLLPEILREHGYLTLAVTGGGWLTTTLGFGQGFSEFVEDTKGIESGTRSLIELIRSHPQGDRPKFVFFHTYQIHAPYDPPQKYRNLYGEFESDFEPTIKNMADTVTSGSTLSPEDLAWTEALYDGEIRYTDDMLRKMFLELDQLGFLDNYVVVITSDHGEEFGEHGALSHPATLYDELLAVPLILAGTSLPKGRVDERMVSSLDIAPTVLTSAGIPVPAHMQGRSLLTQWDDSQDEEAVFAQYGGQCYSVRTRKWKLIENLYPPSFELYRLTDDPREQRNLADETPQIRDALEKRLADWKAGFIDAASGDDSKGDERLSKRQIENLKSLGYLR